MSMICCALMDLRLAHKKPSEVQVKDVRKAFRSMALEKHPDKTGLTGKKNLTEQEEKEYKSAVEQFQKVQHNTEVLEAFVREREEDKEEWTKAKLDYIDNNLMTMIRENYDKIEKDCEKKK